MNEIFWQSPPKEISISDQEIHVWKTSLHKSPLQLSSLTSILSIEEQKQGARFIYTEHQQYFWVTHALLRLILARYINLLQPQQFCFTKGIFGKPYIQNLPNDLNLQFNVSHSNDQALFALAKDQELGVDIELITPKRSCEEIAQRFFANEEYEAWKVLPECQQLTGFYRIWTRKEAYIKAIGLGLNYPLKDFVVSVEKKPIQGLLAVCGDRNIAQTWSLIDLEPVLNYVGAIFVRGKIKRICFWQI